MDEVDNQVRFRDFNEWILSSNVRMGNRRLEDEFIASAATGIAGNPFS